MPKLSPPPPPDFTSDRLPSIVCRRGFINIELFNEMQQHCEALGLPDPDFSSVARVGGSVTAQIAFIRNCAVRAGVKDYGQYRGNLQSCRTKYAAGKWSDETQRQFLELMFPDVVPLPHTPRANGRSRKE
jgi:hypothetical protein